MAVKKQISVVQENRVGTLSRVCSVLAKKKVNILGCCIHDIHDYGVLRLVVDNAGKARGALKSAKIEFSTVDVVVVKLPHVPGAFGQVARKLADVGINIDYAYACGAGSEALGVLKVPDAARADRLLRQ